MYVLNNLSKLYAAYKNETEIIKRLFMDGFEFVTGKKQFIVKNPDAMYEFLAYKIQGYMDDFEVLATDRAYRIGQKNSVQVYKLITNNSIEEKINKMQERKEKLSKDVLYTEETFINKMSKEEILDLFE